MRVHIIHGIHTAGPGSVGLLAPYLQAAGFKTIEPDYGWIAGVETKLVNPIIRDCIFPYVESGDLLVGHSNGAAICYELMMMGAPALGAALINGALAREISRPRGVKAIDCYWNSGDHITEVAKIGQELGLLDAQWGEMGHAGPDTRDPAITSIDCGNTAGMPKVIGHSDFFAALNLESWGPFLAHRLRAMLEAD